MIVSTLYLGLNNGNFNCIIKKRLFMTIGKVMSLVSFILAVAGAINWGLVGLFDLDLVRYFFSNLPVLMKVSYILVGLGGLVMLSRCKSLMS